MCLCTYYGTAAQNAWLPAETLLLRLTANSSGIHKMYILYAVSKPTDVYCYFQMQYLLVTCTQTVSGKTPYVSTEYTYCFTVSACMHTMASYISVPVGATPLLLADTYIYIHPRKGS
jgi:hypothetical protein